MLFVILKFGTWYLVMLLVFGLGHLDFVAPVMALVFVFGIVIWF